MSLHNSRFETQDVVNSFNLFLDSEKSTLVGDKQSEGDNVKLHFEGNSIEAGDGEIIRLSLLNFTMYNNIYHINGNNNTLKIFAGGTTSAISADSGSTVYLTPRYIERLHAVSTDLISKITSHLISRSSTNGATVTSFITINASPPSSYQMQSTGNRLLDITLQSMDNQATPAPIAHALTDITIQCLESEGDSYAILGGNRLDGTPANTDTSFKITVPTTSTIRIQGYYPMQRTSDPYVYVRCNQAQTGLEMSVLQKSRGGSNVDVVNSNILAKAFRQVEFIHYDSATGEEYFMNLQTKKLSNLDIIITDSKGRHLGRKPNQMHNKTASGLYTTNIGDNTFESDNQSTQGNLFFTGVVRVDIVKVRDVRKLETPRLERPSIPSKASGIITWENGGLPRY